MGHVWLARDDVLRRDVAIKEVYLPDGLSEDEADELHLRTLREARTAARLTHPSVIRIYDVLQANDRPWIVMEYVPSRSLAQVVTEDGPLPPQRVATIGLALLGALAAAHDAGVLHRDVKPGNVLLADDGRIVLTDFGLAVTEDFGMQVTQAGVVHGSPQFIAPERAKDGTSNAASDLWSLGATLYAAVEGQSPYARATSYATLAALATEPPDPPKRAGDLKPLLAGLLRRNPNARITPARAERLLLRVAPKSAQTGTVPRQVRRGRSDEIRTPEPRGTAAGPSRLPTPSGLPDRNRGTYEDDRPRRSRPEHVATEPEIDTDSRMAQAWALGTPSPLPAVYGDGGHGRSRRLRIVVLIAVVAVLAAAAGAGGYAISRRDAHGTTSASGDGREPAAGPHPPGLATSARWPCQPPDPAALKPIPSSKPLGTKPAASLGAGWIWYTAPNHDYQVAIEARMRLLTGDGTVCFYDPVATQVAGVSRSFSGGHSPADLLAEQVDQLKSGLPAFRIRQPAAPVPGVPGAAEVQYTYIGPRGLTMRAAMRAIVTESGVTYTVVWQAKDLDWPARGSANYRTFWLTFTPLEVPPTG